MVVLAIGLVQIPSNLTGQQPAPVAPTVPPPRVSRYTPALSLGLPALPVVRQPGANDKPEDKEENGAEKKGNGDVPALSLGECIAIALERQPALRAVQASQLATGAGFQALNNIGRIGQTLSPDLPIRKEQSSRGVIAAAADVQKMHNEIVHDVTRAYYTVVYARQQQQIAEDVVAQIELLVEIGRRVLKSPQPGDMTVAKLDSMEIGLADARILLNTAQTGGKQAYAVLREVMSVQEGFAFRVKDKELPGMAQKIPLTKEQVVEMSLCRRPELALAAAAADAFRLEVYAQERVPFRRAVPTLASGSDIHARLLPTGSRDPGRDYRPEPVAPEMPPQLVGSKADRVSRSLFHSHRADAAYEKARNLMVLEAENTYFLFELASKRVELGKDKFEKAKDLMERIREGVDNPKAPKDTLVVGYAQAAKAQSDYVESVYQYLLTLAALERITAGGVRPMFPGR